MIVLMTSTLIELRSFIRQPASIFWTFIYPVALMLALSFVFGSSSRSEISVYTIHPSIVSNNYVLNAVENLSDLGITVSFAEESESYDLLLDQRTDGTILVNSSTYSEISRLFYLALSEENVSTFAQILIEANEGEPANYNHFLISGVVALSVVTMGLFGFTQVLVGNRAAGRLKWLGYWPMSKVHFLLAFTLSRALIIVVFSMLFIYLFGWLYNADSIWSASSAIYLVLILIAGSICFLSLGMLLASILHKPLTASSVANLLNLPVLFLSDLIVPLSILPEPVADIARLSPIYMFVSTLRSVFDNGATSVDTTVLTTIVSLSVIGIISFVVSGKLFAVTASK